MQLRNHHFHDLLISHLILIYLIVYKLVGYAKITQKSKQTKTSLIKKIKTLKLPFIHQSFIYLKNNDYVR